MEARIAKCRAAGIREQEENCKTRTKIDPDLVVGRRYRRIVFETRRRRGATGDGNAGDDEADEEEDENLLWKVDENDQGWEIQDSAGYAERDEEGNDIWYLGYTSDTQDENVVRRNRRILRAVDIRGCESPTDSEVSTDCNDRLLPYYSETYCAVMRTSIERLSFQTLTLNGEIVMLKRTLAGDTRYVSLYCSSFSKANA